MKRETLASYRPILLTIVALKKQIELLYNPVKSPNGKESVGIGSSTPTPSNPTERTVLDDIEPLRERLEERERAFRAVANEIEDWLEEINNPEIEAIVRVHYFVGRSWQNTSKEVYGSDSKESARQKFKRFMFDLSEKDSKS